MLWQFILNLANNVSSVFHIVDYLDCGSFWFLWSLFFITILWQTGVYLSTTCKIPMIYLHGVTMVALMAIMVVVNYRDHGFQYIAYYYPYYVIGYYSHRFMNKKDVSTPILMGFFILWLVGSLFWNMHDIPFLRFIPLLPPEIMNYGYRYLIGIVAIIAFYGLSKRYLFNFPYLNRIGVLTLGIYTTHIVLFKKFYEYIDGLCNYDVLIIFISFLVFTVISIIIVELISRNCILSAWLLGKINN